MKKTLTKIYVCVKSLCDYINMEENMKVIQGRGNIIRGSGRGGKLKKMIPYTTHILVYL